MLYPHIRTTSTTSTKFVPLVHRHGAGVLQGLAVAGGIGYHYFKVTLDGQPLADNYLSGILGGSAHGNNGLAVGLPFEREILVEIRGSTPSPQTVFWISYAMTRQPSTGEHERRDVDGVVHVFEMTEGEIVLIGPERSSHVALIDDVWLPGEPIVGSVALQRYDGEALFEPTVNLVVRAAGRTHVFGELSTLESVERAQEFRVEWGSIAEILFSRYPRRSFYDFAADYRLGIELIADLPGYANHPSPVL